MWILKKALLIKNTYILQQFPTLTLFRMSFLETLYNGGGGGNCPRFLLVYISTITSARIVIQVCIKRKFDTLLM